MNSITVISAILILLLSVFFFFRARVAFLLGWILKLGYPLLLVVALSSLFVPAIYTHLADQSLQSIGTLDTFSSIDDDLNAIIFAPESIISGLESLITGTASAEETSNGGDVLTEEVYPGMVTTLGGIYRTVALIGSILGMFVVIYLNYITGSVVEIARLQKRVEELEKRG